MDLVYPEYVRFVVVSIELEMDTHALALVVAAVWKM